ncbi:magnesium chelatase domain-containing protein [Nocardioides sp. AN3]
MGFARAHTVALQGAVGHLIDVQADVSPGQVGTTLVGRADAALSEGRDRVRMAITNSRLEWPSTRRITVLLSPADLPKTGTHYDVSNFHYDGSKRRVVRFPQFGARPRRGPTLRPVTTGESHG